MRYYEDNKYRDLYEDLDAHKFGLSKPDCKQLIDIFKALSQPAVADPPANTSSDISSDTLSPHSNKRVHESDNTPGVYVLRLRHKKYYVGFSNNKRRRIDEHREGQGEGTEFTEEYAVVEEIEPLTEPMADLNLWELKETLTRMKVHGIKNVRGSRWCQLVLQQSHIEDIKNEMVTYITSYSRTHLLTHLLSHLFICSLIKGYCFKSVLPLP